MATSKTFKVAGITVHGDVAKVRFTADMIRRIKQFTKGGATRCDLLELPNEMTKVDAVKYLMAHANFQSPEDQATLADCLADKEKGAGKTEVKVKVAKAPKASAKKPSIDAIKARAKPKKAEPTAEELVKVATENTDTESA